MRINKMTVHGIMVKSSKVNIENIRINGDSMHFNAVYYVEGNDVAFASEEYSCAYNVKGGAPIIQAEQYFRNLYEVKDAEDV